MRAILIDPVEKTVTEISFAGGLDAMYAVLNCSSVELAPHRLPGGKNFLYVDEEGLFKEGTGSYVIYGAPAPYVGRGLIVGASAKGSDIATKLSIEVARELIVFVD